MVATLTRIFGVENLNLAEDVVQEALARALQTWPFYGVPKNPSAWIMRASRNLALDVVRRRKVFQNKQAEIIRLMDRDGVGPDEAIFSEDEIADDRLRLMFVCCHPAIPPDAQIALALRIGTPVVGLHDSFEGKVDIPRVKSPAEAVRWALERARPPS